MHILFLSDNFPPEVNAPASRTHEHVREWVAAGNSVTVITCAPNFPRGRVFDGYRNRLWQSEMVDGIRVIRVWSYITVNEGFARRVADYVSYMVAATIAALFVRRVDVVVATSPQFFTAVAGWLVGTLKRRPWVFELRDIWPESIRAVGAMKQSRIMDWLEQLELFLYRRADMVIAVTESFRSNLIRRGILPEKIHVITNGVDTTRYQPMDKDSRLAAALGLHGSFVAGYIGTIGMAHALGTILDASKILSASSDASDIHILIIGDGADRDALQNRARTEGISNVTFLDSVAKTEVARYWSLLDASIIHLRKADLFKTVIPSKLFECMAMGIPVLLGVQGEAAEIVERHDIGILIEPESATILAQGLIRLQQDQELCLRFARNGQVAAQQFNRKALAVKMLALLRSLARSDS